MEPPQALEEATTRFVLGGSGCGRCGRGWISPCGTWIRPRRRSHRTAAADAAVPWTAPSGRLRKLSLRRAINGGGGGSGCRRALELHWRQTARKRMRSAWEGMRRSTRPSSSGGRSGHGTILLCVCVACLSSPCGSRTATDVILLDPWRPKPSRRRTVIALFRSVALRPKPRPSIITSAAIARLVQKFWLSGGQSIGALLDLCSYSIYIGWPASILTPAPTPSRVS